MNREVWVLADTFRGRTWFKEMTAIGPCGTWDETEAARFPSERAAMESPAFSFPLTFYRPEQLVTGASGNDIHLTVPNGEAQTGHNAKASA